jgi:hypothetical protein
LANFRLPADLPENGQAVIHQSWTLHPRDQYTWQLLVFELPASSFGGRVIDEHNWFRIKLREPQHKFAFIDELNFQRVAGLREPIGKRQPIAGLKLVAFRPWLNRDIDWTILLIDDRVLAGGHLWNVCYLPRPFNSGRSVFHQVATFALLIGINPKRSVCIRPNPDLQAGDPGAQ